MFPGNLERNLSRLAARSRTSLNFLFCFCCSSSLDNRPKHTTVVIIVSFSSSHCFITPSLRNSLAWAKSLPCEICLLIPLELTCFTGSQPVNYYSQSGLIYYVLPPAVLRYIRVHTHGHMRDAKHHTERTLGPLERIIKIQGPGWFTGSVALVANSKHIQHL